MTASRHRTQRNPSAKRAGTIDPPAHELARLVAGEHAHPHELLGAHPATVDNTKGLVVRALAPDAERCECVLATGEIIEAPRIARGVSTCFAAFLPEAE